MNVCREKSVRGGRRFVGVWAAVLFIVASCVGAPWHVLPPTVRAASDMSPGIACEGAPMVSAIGPGTKSNVVWEVRQQLHRLGLAVGDLEDDRYDRHVQAAVRALQRAHGLAADGIVGPLTWAALVHDDEPAVFSSTLPPPTGDVSIVVDTERLELTVFSDDQPYKTYPVAVGRPKTTTLTPVGEWRVVHKAVNWGGGFGTRWIGLNVPWGIYGIHGTNNPGSIGTRASAGCIRMFNRDVEELYEWVPIGARVVITGVKRPVSFERTLRSGTQGPDVVELQLRLNALGFHVGDADGRFGPKTEAALRRLQRTFALPEDGQAWTDVYYVLGLK